MAGFVRERVGLAEGSFGMSKSNVTLSLGTMSLTTVLFVVFLTLRLTDQIDWAWYWIAAPLWVPWAVFLGIGAAILLCLGLFVGGAGVVDFFRGNRRAKAEKYARRMK